MSPTPGFKTRSEATKIQVAKVLGTKNMADVLTKYVDRSSLEAAMGRMHMVKTSGRSAMAPKAMGACPIKFMQLEHDDVQIHPLAAVPMTSARKARGR